MAIPARPSDDLVLAHGASWGSKLWPERFWTQLARRAAKAGLRPLLPWLGRERERARRIAAAVPEAVVCPPTNVAQALDLVARARAVVGVDSGLGHFAAAIGRPTVMVLGPTDPNLTGCHGAFRAQCGRGDGLRALPVAALPLPGFQPSVRARLASPTLRRNACGARVGGPHGWRTRGRDVVRKRLGETREPTVVRVAFAIHSYSSHSGLARDLRKIASECARRGHRVRVYAMRWQGERLEDADTVLLPVAGVRGHVRQRRFAAAVQRHRRGNPVDLLVGMNKMPGLDGYYAGDVCFVAKARGQRPRAYRWTPRYRHFAAFEESVFGAEAATEVLTISPRETDIYQAVYGTPSRRLHALPPGLERWCVPDPASRGAARAALGAADGDALLLFVGLRLRPPRVGPAACARLRRCRKPLRARTCLRVIGADRAGAFERLARRLGVASRVRFLGGRDDVPALLGAADGLLLPSRNEATGTVILEAAAAGVPVLATANCGYASVHCERGCRRRHPRALRSAALQHRSRALARLGRTAPRGPATGANSAGDNACTPCRARRWICSSVSPGGDEPRRARTARPRGACATVEAPLPALWRTAAPAPGAGGWAGNADDASWDRARPAGTCIFATTSRRICAWRRLPSMWMSLPLWKPLTASRIVSPALAERCA